ncbi:hypothetical protein [Novosphingobium sp.]|uniref:hypothetical protein n=1 Tax=Novosphingobium sp. TaxID=1874826 RepID=UPI0025CCEF62|nr:hypothetical protein [Novosphingobium sp.]
MFGAITVIIAGVLVAWWAAKAFGGWKSYAIGIAAALLTVPACGYLASWLDSALFGGDARHLHSMAIGLGLAVALFEVPLIIFKRKRRAD